MIRIELEWPRPKGKKILELLIRSMRKVGVHPILDSKLEFKRTGSTGVIKISVALEKRDVLLRQIIKNLKEMEVSTGRRLTFSTFAG
jgi:hypothetical protein